MKRFHNRPRTAPFHRIPWWLDVIAVLLTGGIILPVVVWYRLCAVEGFPSR